MSALLQNNKIALWLPPVPPLLTNLISSPGSEQIIRFLSTCLLRLIYSPEVRQMKNGK